MESSTEQSTSPHQPQPAQPQDQQLPLDQALDLSPEAQPEFQPESQPESPELQLSEPAPEPEPPSAEPVAEGDVPEPEAVAPEPETVQEQVTYGSLDEVTLDNLPPEVRSHVEPIMTLIKMEQDQLESERATYEELNTEITTLIDGLSQAQKGDVEPLVAEYQVISGAYQDMSRENITMAQRLFGVQYPEFGNQPEKVRAAFVEALSSDRFHSRYEGETIYDKMVDAYTMAVFRNGGTLRPAATPGPEGSVQPGSRSPSLDAKKQALVSGGNQSSNLPTINLDTMSYEDILSRGEHLLDL